jgi:hypothetical protein
MTARYPVTATNNVTADHKNRAATSDSDSPQPTPAHAASSTNHTSKRSAVRCSPVPQVFPNCSPGKGCSPN